MFLRVIRHISDRLKRTCLRVFIPDSVDGFQIGRKLGHGRYSLVYAVYDEVKYVSQPGVSQMPHQAVAPQSEVCLKFITDKKLAYVESHALSALNARHGIPRWYGCSFQKGYAVLIEQRVQASPLCDSRQSHFIFLGHESALFSFVVSIAEQLIELVAYCHKRGISHNDIQPRNILLDREERPWLIDFGLASFFDPHDDEHDYLHSSYDDRMGIADVMLWMLYAHYTGAKRISACWEEELSLPQEMTAFITRLQGERETFASWGECLSAIRDVKECIS